MTYLLTVESSADGITALRSSSTIVVEAHTEKLYIVPIRIAQQVPQGNYTVWLKRTNKDGVQSIQSKELAVAGVRKLTLTPTHSSDYVKAGARITASFLAKNSGNMPEKLTLTADHASIDSGAEMTLLPGESKTIMVSKSTDAAIEATMYQVLHLSAKVDAKTHYDAYSTVRIIPIAAKENDVFFRLPVSLSLSYIGSRNRGSYQGGYQVEMYGNGSLSKENKDMLSFHMVTPGPVPFNAFTPYEQYFVTYQKGGLYAYLGDKSYTASYLTENARYGRGAELSYTFGKVILGGFYNRPRFFRDIKNEASVYAKYQLNRQTEMTISYLYKMPVTGVVGAHLPSISATTKLLKNTELQGELAYSKNGKAEGVAFRTQVQRSIEKLLFGLTFMKASTNFAGYFSNSHSGMANVAFRASKKVNMYANYRQDARNYKKDTLYGVAPYRNHFQTGLQYNYLKNSSLKFFGGFQKYEDQMPVKQYNYDEVFLKINLDQRINMFRLDMGGQVGKTNNYLSEFSGLSKQYFTNIGFAKLTTSVNFYASYAQTARYQIKDQKNINYGARLTNRFGRNANLSIFYQNNYMPEESYRDRNLFEMRYHQQILKNHELDVTARYTLQPNQPNNKDFILSLRYLWRINVPIKKIAKYATLSGTIANLGTAKTDGIKLWLGNQSAVTDSNGHYRFKNIPPGQYYLEIDRITTGLTDIADTLLPLAIHLTNKETILNFGLSKAAKIAGTVQVDQAGNEGQSIYDPFLAKNDPKRAESLIVEASNGTQLYRKIVTIGQEFDFTYLRPGNWKVKVYRNGLDKRYKIASELFDVDLQPDETRALTIRIIRQQREIKYQQESLKVGYNQGDK
ncbi:hypothetical protein [Arundinibacter roseus]|uniref:Carboxypeptidase regulatory-like domain-containing protein n=1 Tax=Arundinibacter roseus TaxID=2070510 RepID=A0A4V2X8D8_9BACT|nr:hypothetical protein [Arundinibacter roseus]TDB59535.1 hypothetical protein EZE20_22285 [Arundinibacter roseus]